MEGVVVEGVSVRKHEEGPFDSTSANVHVTKIKAVRSFLKTTFEKCTLRDVTTKSKKKKKNQSPGNGVSPRGCRGLAEQYTLPIQPSCLPTSQHSKRMTRSMSNMNLACQVGRQQGRKTPTSGAAGFSGGEAVVDWSNEGQVVDPETSRKVGWLTVHEEENCNFFFFVRDLLEENLPSLLYPMPKRGSSFGSSPRQIVALLQQKMSAM